MLSYIPSLGSWGITGPPRIPKALEPARGENKSTECEPVQEHINPKDAPDLLGQWVGDLEECDKVLFLNHLIFDPVRALHLLFCTNQNR